MGPSLSAGSTLCYNKRKLTHKQRCKDFNLLFKLCQITKGIVKVFGVMSCGLNPDRIEFCVNLIESRVGT